MHPSRILTALRDKRCTYADIAGVCEVSKVAVHNTVYGKPFPSPKVQREIARVLGVPVSDLWPEGQVAA